MAVRIRTHQIRGIRKGFMAAVRAGHVPLAVVGKKGDWWLAAKVQHADNTVSYVRLFHDKSYKTQVLASIWGQHHFGIKVAEVFSLDSKANQKKIAA